MVIGSPDQAGSGGRRRVLPMDQQQTPIQGW
jgi:hypothetical protein